MGMFLKTTYLHVQDREVSVYQSIQRSYVCVQTLIQVKLDKQKLTIYITDAFKTFIKNSDCSHNSIISLPFFRR